MLELSITPNCPFKDKLDLIIEYVKLHGQDIAKDSNVTLECDDIAFIKLEDGSHEDIFSIDIFNKELMWRISHSGKNSEAVCKAVLGKLEKPIVFDATAGLGRESLILQQSGCIVYMFERNPIVWTLLLSCLYNNQDNQTLLSSLKNGFPKLSSFGSVKDNLEKGLIKVIPDVIYYDPMFPERQKSAKVKKQMQVFHKIVGFDEDTLDYANYLCSIAKHHLVVKRPANEPPLELNFRRSSFVDGKACRFDCYYTNN